jgi:hypothetical protein
MAVADDAERKADLGRGAGPMESGGSVALPVFAEAEDVTSVVRPEVEEDGTGVTGGQRRRPPRREGQQKARRGARPPGQESVLVTLETDS